MSATNIDVISEALNETTLDDLSARHRKERKDLQAKIQALKKNAPKSDKKKRKEAMEEVTRLEHDMETRQANELQTMQQQLSEINHHLEDGVNSIKEDDTNISTNIKDDTVVSTPRITKAQKRRDKKEREARQRDEDIRAAAEDVELLPKAVELRSIHTKLKERQLALYQISSDGDCLYNAIRHQLEQYGLNVPTLKELRNETANYIKAHKEALIHYMTNPKTDEPLTDDEFDNYCEAVRSTPAWGGHIELKALSSILKVPIEVIQAEGPPTVQGGTEFAGPNLIVTYHRHMYSLGEHYNSTQPLSDVPNATTNDDRDDSNC